MSVVRNIFLFDYEHFGKLATPVLEELRNGSYSGLQKLANETAKRHPEVWGLLDNLYYFGIKNYVWDYTNNIRGAIAFWITILICRCGVDLDIESIKSDPAFSGDLRQLGVDEKLVDTLLWGKPLNHLLLDLASSNDNSHQYPFENLDFKIGWLSIEDIQDIRTEIQAYQAQNPHPAYNNLLNILNSAISAMKGLALGVVM